MSCNRVPCYPSGECSTISGPQINTGIGEYLYHDYEIVLINCCFFILSLLNTNKYYNAKKHSQVTQLKEEYQIVSLHPSQYKPIPFILYHRVCLHYHSISMPVFPFPPYMFNYLFIHAFINIFLDAY